MNTPISFEIAKLLKEKGFNKRSEPYRYNKNGEITFLEGINAPVISEVVMWLYKKHGIWISVEQNSFIGGGKSSFISNVKRAEYNSPTEAYEAAIDYTLKNLIK